MVENHASGSSSSQAEKGNGGERLITDISEIIRLDERLWDVTRGLPIKLGSLTRLPSDSYLNWGIGLTDENKAELASMSRFWYDKDIEEDMAHAFVRHLRLDDPLRRQGLIGPPPTAAGGAS